MSIIHVDLHSKKRLVNESKTILKLSGSLEGYLGILS